MEATSDFGNISKAGLQFSRNDNKLGVYSLYEPDFTSAKKHVYDLMNELPENCYMINAPNILRKLEKYDRPKIRLWDETDPVEMRLDCSFNKLREITKLTKGIVSKVCSECVGAGWFHLCNRDMKDDDI